MKKTILFLMTAVLLLTALVMPAAAAESGTVTINSASVNLGDTVTLTVSLTGFDKANTLGVVIDAPEGLAFDGDNSRWLLSDGVLETLTATKGAWAVEDARNVNTDILQLVYTVEEFCASYPIAVTLQVKNNETTLGEETVFSTVTVTNPTKELTLSAAELELCISDDDTEGVITATVTPSDTTDSLIWSTSNSDVVTVKDGIVTAHDSGTATITVRSGSCTASCFVTVTCDHEYEDWFVVTEPTETEDGSRRRNCSFCSHYETEVIPCLKLQAPVVEITNKASNGAPYLTWDAVEDAVKYEVWRATGKDGEYTLLSTTKGTSLSNTSTTTGNTYCYKVLAVDANGRKSEFSAVVEGIRLLSQPVVKVSNVASTGKIKLTWGKITGAAKYEVYRSTDGGSSYSLLKTTTGTSLTNTSTTAGSTYYYKIRAIHSNAAANSLDSAVVSRTCDLAQPVLKVANVISTGKIKLTWDKVSDAAKYEIYRSTDGGSSYSLLKSTTGTSLTNTSTTAGNTYYYKIRAIHSNADANSADSSVVSGICRLAQPAVKVSNVASTGKIKLTWDKVSGAAKYNVYRSTDGGNSYSLLKATTGTSLTNTSTTAGSKYYYKVMAIHENNSAANSVYSSAVSRICDLARPTITVTLNSKKQPVISWKAVEGAVKYEIWRAVGDGSYSKLSTTTKLKLTNTSAVSGNTYSYKVRAICSNSSGNSAYSTAKSITRP